MLYKQVNSAVLKGKKNSASGGAKARGDMSIQVHEEICSAALIHADSKLL